MFPGSYVRSLARGHPILDICCLGLPAKLPESSDQLFDARPFALTAGPLRGAAWCSGGMGGSPRGKDKHRPRYEDGRWRDAAILVRRWGSRKNGR